VLSYGEQFPIIGGSHLNPADRLTTKEFEHQGLVDLTIGRVLGRFEPAYSWPESKGTRAVSAIQHGCRFVVAALLLP